MFPYRLTDIELPRLVGQVVSIQVVNSQLPDRFLAHLSGGDPKNVFVVSSLNLGDVAALQGRHLVVRIDQLTEENTYVEFKQSSGNPIN